MLYPLIPMRPCLRRAASDIQIMYPLDVVKTRQQLSTDAKSMGIGATLRSIVAQEGWVTLAYFIHRSPFHLGLRAQCQVSSDTDGFRQVKDSRSTCPEFRSVGADRSY